MNKLLEIYDIEIKDEIKIECIYFYDNILENIKLTLESNSKEEKVFQLVFTEAKFENKNAVKAIIKLPLTYKQYKIKCNNKPIQWKNNQGKQFNFKENNYIIFKDKFMITMSEDGILIAQRKMCSKFLYNFKKTIYGLKKYKKIYLYRFLKKKSKYYLINDRVIDANDNGEALFTYINDSNLKISKNTYFVINKKSDKIKELKKKGKVLKFGSINHKIKYINSKVVASSYIGNTKSVYNPFSEDEMEIYKDIINKKVLFLQHGIIMNDFHMMFNRPRMVIDKFVVSSKKEWEGIKNLGYFYEDDRLIKTGLARYDKLVNNPKKRILIFFTWRKRLTKMTEEEFKDSNYYKKVTSLINNINVNEYDIQIVIHQELDKYTHLFKNAVSSKNITYSEIFANCSIAITDYSSIHFDVAYLKKPVIYYQFDINEYLKNNTSMGFGNFNYKKDAFGEVLEKEEDVIKTLEKYIGNSCQMEEKYLARLENTFFYTDNKNSKRISEELYNMGKDLSINYRFNNVQ